MDSHNIYSTFYKILAYESKDLVSFSYDQTSTKSIELDGGNTISATDIAFNVRNKQWVDPSGRDLTQVLDQVGTEQCQISTKFDLLETTLAGQLNNLINSNFNAQTISSIDATITNKKLFYHDAGSQHDGKSSGNATLDITITLDNGDGTTTIQTVTAVLFLTNQVTNKASDLNVEYDGKKYGIAMAFHTDTNLYGNTVNKELLNLVKEKVGFDEINLDVDSTVSIDDCLESKNIMVPHFLKDGLLDTEKELTETKFTTHNLTCVMPSPFIPVEVPVLGRLRGNQSDSGVDSSTNSGPGGGDSRPASPAPDDSSLRRSASCPDISGHVGNSRPASPEPNDSSLRRAQSCPDFSSFRENSPPPPPQVVQETFENRLQNNPDSESTVNLGFFDDDESVHSVPETVSTDLEFEPQPRTIQLSKGVTHFETVQQVAALGCMQATGSHDNPYQVNDTVVKIQSILTSAGQGLQPMTTDGFDTIPMNELDNFDEHVNPETLASLRDLQHVHGEAFNAFSHAENEFNRINHEIAQLVKEKEEKIASVNRAMYALVELIPAEIKLEDGETLLDKLLENTQFQEAFNALYDGSILVNGGAIQQWLESLQSTSLDETEDIAIHLSLNPGILLAFDDGIQHLKQAQLQVVAASHEGVATAFNALKGSADALCTLTTKLDGNTTNLDYDELIGILLPGEIQSLLSSRDSFLLAEFKEDPITFNDECINLEDFPEAIEALNTSLEEHEARLREFERLKVNAPYTGHQDRLREALGIDQVEANIQAVNTFKAELVRSYNALMDHLRAVKKPNGQFDVAARNDDRHLRQDIKDSMAALRDVTIPSITLPVDNTAALSAALSAEIEAAERLARLQTFKCRPEITQPAPSPDVPGFPENPFLNEFTVADVKAILRAQGQAVTEFVTSGFDNIKLNELDSFSNQMHPRAYDLLKQLKDSYESAKSKYNEQVAAKTVVRSRLIEHRNTQRDQIQERMAQLQGVLNGIRIEADRANALDVLKGQIQGLGNTDHILFDGKTFAEFLRDLVLPTEEDGKKDYDIKITLSVDPNYLSGLNSSLGPVSATIPIDYETIAAKFNGLNDVAVHLNSVARASAALTPLAIEFSSSVGDIKDALRPLIGERDELRTNLETEFEIAELDLSHISEILDALKKEEADIQTREKLNKILEESPIYVGRSPALQAALGMNTVQANKVKIQEFKTRLIEAYNHLASLVKDVKKPNGQFDVAARNEAEALLRDNIKQAIQALKEVTIADRDAYNDLGPLAQLALLDLAVKDDFFHDDVIQWNSDGYRKKKRENNGTLVNAHGELVPNEESITTLLLKNDDEFADALTFIPGRTIEAGEADSTSTITIQNLYRTLTSLCETYDLDQPETKRFFKIKEVPRGGASPVLKGGSQLAGGFEANTPIHGDNGSFRGRAKQVSAKATIMNFSGIVQSVNDKAGGFDEDDESLVEFTAFADLINRYNMALKSPPTSPRRSPSPPSQRLAEIKLKLSESFSPGLPIDGSPSRTQVQGAGGPAIVATAEASSPSTPVEGAAGPAGTARSGSGTATPINECVTELPIHFSNSKFDEIWKAFVESKYAQTTQALTKKSKQLIGDIKNPVYQEVIGKIKKTEQARTVSGSKRKTIKVSQKHTKVQAIIPLEMQAFVKCDDKGSMGHQASRSDNTQLANLKVLLMKVWNQRLVGALSSENLTALMSQSRCSQLKEREGVGQKLKDTDLGKKIKDLNNSDINLRLNTIWEILNQQFTFMEKTSALPQPIVVEEGITHILVPKFTVKKSGERYFRWCTVPIEQLNKLTAVELQQIWTEKARSSAKAGKKAPAKARKKAAPEINYTHSISRDIFREGYEPKVRNKSLFPHQQVKVEKESAT